MSYDEKCHKKPAKDKKVQEKRHANNRMKDRFGMPLSQDILDYILWQIRNAGSVFIEKQSNRVTLHLVILKEKQLVRVVYDKNRNTIVTVLNPKRSDYELPKRISPPQW